MSTNTPADSRLPYELLDTLLSDESAEVQPRNRSLRCDEQGRCAQDRREPRLVKVRVDHAHTNR